MLPRTATNHRQFKHPVKPGRVTINGRLAICGHLREDQDLAGTKEDGIPAPRPTVVAEQIQYEVNILGPH